MRVNNCSFVASSGMAVTNYEEKERKKKVFAVSFVTIGARGNPLFMVSG